MLCRSRVCSYAIGRYNTRWIRFGKKAVVEQPDLEPPDRTDMSIEELKMVDPVTGADRSRWLFTYDKELKTLACRLGHTLDKLPSLQLALTHRSAVAKERKAMAEVNRGHNGRLMALGSTSLELYISEFLYCTYPNMEGYCIKDITSYLTNPCCLSLLANQLGVASLVLTRSEPFNTAPSFVTNIESISSAHSKSSTLSHTFCAVVGAVYVDQGPRAARELIHTLFIPLFKELDVYDMIKLSHPKFILLKLMEEQGREPPVCRIVNETGRLSHFPTFHMAMYSGKQLLGEGVGTSKARAENEAAATAVCKHFLKQLKRISLPSDYDDFIPESNISLMEEVNPDCNAKQNNALFQSTMKD